MREAWPDCHLPLTCSIRGTRGEKEGPQSTKGKQGGDIWSVVVLVPEGIWKWVGKCHFLAVWASCMFQSGRGETKAEGQRRAIANILLAQSRHMSPSPSVGRTKRICLDLEYKPCLESGNALKGTSKNVLENSEIAYQSLILQMGKGLSTPIPISSIHILSGRKVPNSCPASPIQPLSSSKLPLRTLFSSSPPSCPALLLQSDALSLYASMSRTAWPHYSAGTTTTLSP